MKKLYRLLLLAVLSASCILLGGCAENEAECAHRWSGSNCSSPATCEKCGETTGPLGDHSFTGATCDTAESCLYCDLTRGEPLGHNFKARDCGDPMKCSRCHITNGSVLEHNYNPATCTEPERCTRCHQKGETEAFGHKFEGITCTVCKDKVAITKYTELSKFLMENLNKINTALGTIEVHFNIVEFNPLFDGRDFEIKILSDNFYVKEYEKSLRSLLDSYQAIFPYEDRKQAFLDVLDYEMKIIKAAEEAFPGKKFSVYFYDSGYAYPSLGLGFHSETYLPFQNWEAGKSELCDWYMREITDSFIECTQVTKHEPCGLHDDIKAARPEYNLKFKGYLN